MCEAVLKRICRRHHLTKWPYRRLKQLQKQIEDLELRYTRECKKVDGTFAMSPESLSSRYREEKAQLYDQINWIIHKSHEARDDPGIGFVTPVLTSSSSSTSDVITPSPVLASSLQDRISPTAQACTTTNCSSDVSEESIECWIKPPPKIRRQLNAPAQWSTAAVQLPLCLSDEAEAAKMLLTMGASVNE